MMGPGFSFFIIVDAIFRPYVLYQLPAPQNPSILFNLLLWFSGWNWLLIIFPVLFTLVIFPTGRPLTPR